MVDFREAADEQADAIRELLGPPMAEIGQRVWWTDHSGRTIYQGRIRRIEVGTARDGYYRWEARSYAAQSERCIVCDYAGRENEYESTTTWESECISKDGEEMRTLFLSYEGVLQKASEKMRIWAEQTRADADRREKIADYWLTLME